MQHASGDEGVDELNDEGVDWIDEDDRVIEVVTRARMRAENLRHRSVAIVVLSGDRLLVHRRSEAKDLWPGWWDIAAGGVVDAGESYDDAARRELAEELGLTDVTLEPLGTVSYEDEHVRERCTAYVLRYDEAAHGPVRFDDGEVMEARWVTAAELTAMQATHRFLPDSVAMLMPLLREFGG